jgi:hypothetical protein
MVKKQKKRKEFAKKGGEKEYYLSGSRPGGFPKRPGPCALR